TPAHQIMWDNAPGLITGLAEKEYRVWKFKGLPTSGFTKKGETLKSSPCHKSISQFQYIYLPAAGMGGVEPNQIPLGAPTAVNITAPEPGKFLWLDKPSQGHDCFSFHIHQVNFLFPQTTAGIRIGDHPLLVRGKGAMPVVIQQTIAKPLVIIFSNRIQYMGILFPLKIGSNHQFIIIQPVKMGALPIVRKTALQLGSVPVYGK